MSVSDVKKLNSPPSGPHHRICRDLEGNNSNTGIRHPSIRGSFDGRRTPSFRFLTRSSSDHTSVSRTGFFYVSGHTMASQTEFFLSLFWPRISVTIPHTRSVRLWYGHWRPSLKYLFKKTSSDRPWYGHWCLGRKRLKKKKNKKNPVCEIVVWPQADRVKNLIKKITRSVRQRYGLW